MLIASAAIAASTVQRTHLAQVRMRVAGTSVFGPRYALVVLVAPHCTRTSLRRQRRRPFPHPMSAQVFASTRKNEAAGKLELGVHRDGVCGVVRSEDRVHFLDRICELVL